MKTPQDVQQALGGTPVLDDIVSIKLAFKAKKGLPVARRLHPQASDALSGAISRLVNVPELSHRFGQFSRQRAEEMFDTILISGQARVIYHQFISSSSGRNL